MSGLSVVVPARDEAQSLGALVARIRRVAEAEGWDWELICVLDGCVDESREVLAACAEPRLHVVELPRSRGQHAALDAGLRVARGEILLSLDADLQTPPEALPRLVDALRGGAEVAAGWRRSREDRRWRRLASGVFNRLTSRLVGLHGHDLGCMMRGWQRSLVEDYLASGEAPLYLPVQIERHARRRAEVEVPHAARAHGRSHYDARRLARLGLAVLRARFAPPPR